MVKFVSFSFIIVGALFYLTCGGAYGAINIENIVGMWLFDNDEDPLIAVDSSGRGHNGQIRGAQWIDGKFGKALLFDGVDDNVEVPHADDLTLPNFTFTAWFNSAGPNNMWQGILGKEAWPIRNYSFYIHRDTKTLGCNFVHDGNEQQHKEVIAKTQVMDGHWHHAAVTYDMKNYIIYTDGVVEGQRPVTNKPDENALPVRIGTGGPFNGMLDEVVIFNEALEAEDIIRIMDGMSKLLASVEPGGKLTTLWGGLKMNR